MQGSFGHYKKTRARDNFN